MSGGTDTAIRHHPSEATLVGYAAGALWEVPSQRLLEIDGGASGSMTVSRQAARSIMLLAGG